MLPAANQRMTHGREAKTSVRGKRGRISEILQTIPVIRRDAVLCSPKKSKQNAKERQLMRNFDLALRNFSRPTARGNAHCAARPIPSYAALRRTSLSISAVAVQYGFFPRVLLTQRARLIGCVSD